MTGRWTACALACALAAGGCGGGGGEAADARPLEGVGESAGGLLVATVWLRDLGSSEPVGWITFTESLPGTVVQVRVEGRAPGTRLVATLSGGRCGGGARGTEPLGRPVEVGGDGAGRSEARIQASLEPLLDGAHSVRLARADDPTATLACGDLPERAEVPDRVL